MKGPQEEDEEEEEAAHGKREEPTDGDGGVAKWGQARGGRGKQRRKFEVKLLGRV